MFAFISQLPHFVVKTGWYLPLNAIKLKTVNPCIVYKKLFRKPTLGPNNLVEVGPLKDASCKYSKYFDQGTIIRLYFYFMHKTRINYVHENGIVQ